MSGKDKLKVGLLCDPQGIDYISRKIIENANSNNLYDVSFIFLNKSLASEGGSIPWRIRSKIENYGWVKFSRSALFNTIDFFEKKIFNEYSGCGQVELDNIKTIDLFPNVSKNRLVHRYTAEDIEKIRHSDVDVLIRCGQGIIRGDVLSCCEFGVLSFHHGDNSTNRGGPAGYWEVYERRDETGFVIQRLTNELDGGDILVRASFKTMNNAHLNKFSLIERSIPYMDRLLSYISRQGELPDAENKKPYSNRLYKMPTVGQQLTYLAKQAGYFSKKFSKRATGRKYEWFVGLVSTSGFNKTVLNRQKAIENPVNGYYADPMLFEKEGKKYLFLEEFSYKKNKAEIAAILLDRNNNPIRTYQNVISEPFHLSYPYVFSCGDQVYMIPESHEVREIRLYRCLRMPDQWVFEKTLISDVSAADTNIAFHEGHWWLFTSIAEVDSADHHSQLFLYYTDDLICGVWQAHPKNPVLSDSRRGRNAGCFIFEEGKIFRPFQSQSWGHYGKSCGVAEVKVLNEKEYLESVEFLLRPNFLENSIGVHTYSALGSSVAIDFLVER